MDVHTVMLANKKENCVNCFQNEQIYGNQIEINTQQNVDIRKST